jgi:hypothetical protein
MQRPRNPVEADGIAERIAFEHELWPGDDVLWSDVANRMHIRRLGNEVWERSESLDGRQNLTRAFVEPLRGLRVKTQIW